MKNLIVAVACLLSTEAFSQALESVPTPPQQEKFNQIIQKYAEAFATAENEMAAGAQRSRRAKEICGILKKHSIKDWTGFITELSSNGDGLGVLTIETGKGTTVGTWNNSLSDFRDGTLLDPDGRAFQQAMTLTEGQAVKFSGTFVKSKVDCVGEKSITLSGSMTKPEFLIKFTNIEQLGEKYVKPKSSILNSLFQ